MKTISNYWLGLWAMLVALSACQNPIQRNMDKRTLSDNWTFQQVNGELSGPATVPGVIHTDLLAQGAIEDPFYRTNEKDLQWIDKEDWTYKTTFELSAAEMGRENMLLHFAGLDTYADVYVNDSLLLSSNNMFRTYEVNIAGVAKQGQNTLEVYLHSPIKEGLKLLEASPYGYPAANDQSENGGLGDKKVSVFTRKAGYHYGWDWGPRFVTSGIWRPVTLLLWDKARISDVFIKQPSVTKELAKLEAHIEVDANTAFKGELVVINTATGATVAQSSLAIEAGTSVYTVPFEIANPTLWWSAGLGEPAMYNFEVTLKAGSATIAQEQVRTGLRSIKLVREKDAEGESFLFELNGVRIFAKGANYIPNDNFLTRVDSADYRKVIADAVDANMNMLRVWGGGIYENDLFYELCDENGLLVWQDFMFACSMYPGNEAFLDNVKHEAIDNVKRLRNHPSIALWCGNNEINTAWNYYSEGGWGWKQLYTKEQQDEIQKAYLDIFHGVLADAVEGYHNEINYWPSSPQAGYEPDQHTSYTTTSGDMHYWGVWHGLHPFEDFDKYRARFMSEYGFQSFPDFETVKKYTVEEDFDIESDVMAAHQRSGIGNLRIREYMGWEYKVPQDFEQFLYMSQVLQARGIKMAIEAHRRAMPYCMGSLYWQINDCWPVASWSSTDYYKKWKAVHYAVRRAYEPVVLSAFAQGDAMQLYGVSDLLDNKSAKLQLTVIDFAGKVVKEEAIDVTLNANTSTLLQDIDLKTMIGAYDRKGLLLHATLLEGEKVLTSNHFYFAKPKEQTMPQANLTAEVVVENGKTYVEVKTDKLVRDLYLNVLDQDIAFADNYFDLLPGQTRRIEVLNGKTFTKDQLQVIHLQQMK